MTAQGHSKREVHSNFEAGSRQTNDKQVTGSRLWMTSLQQVHSKVEVVGDKSAAVSRQASDRQATDFATGRKLLVTSSQVVHSCGRDKQVTGRRQIYNKFTARSRQASDRQVTGRVTTGSKYNRLVTSS